MGTLFVVGTPIGNLEDMTARGVRVLGKVSVVAAEDTRVTRRLLTHLGIRVPLISYRQHNWQVQLPVVLSFLEAADVALVCDAGMPVMSDPGSGLVSAASAAGFPVEVVPGPSAVTAALAVSGCSADEFLFLGFLPRHRKKRQERLRSVAPLNFTMVIFEAPHRVRATLEDLLVVLGDREMSVCRELTKLHEEVFRGTVSQSREWLQTPRGEYVLVIRGGEKHAASDVGHQSREDEARRQIGRLRKNGTRAKDAVAEVAAAVDLPKNRIYRMWVESASGPPWTSSV